MLFLQSCKAIVGRIHAAFLVVIFQLVQMNGAWTDCYLSITSDFPPAPVGAAQKEILCD